MPLVASLNREPLKLSLPVPVLWLEDLAVPGGRFDVQACAGQVVVLEQGTPMARWRALAVAAGYAFGGPGRCRIAGIDTRSLDDQQRQQLRRHQVAQALLADTLSPLNTLQQEVSHAASMRAKDESSAHRDAMRTLERLGLLHSRFTPCAALAASQRRLGLVACALVRHAPLLVLERPEIDLDAAAIGLLRSALWMAAYEDRSCVLMTTMEPALASLADAHVPMRPRAA